MIHTRAHTFAGACTAMLRAVKDHLPVDMLAVHFHNTYAMALPNMLAALEVTASQPASQLTASSSY